MNTQPDPEKLRDINERSKRRPEMIPQKHLILGVDYPPAKYVSVQISLLLAKRRDNKRMNSVKRPGGWQDFLGCSAKELLEHIEKQFEQGMKWEDYGTTGKWRLQYVKPLNEFDMSKDMLKAFHYSNIKPVWTAYQVRKQVKDSPLPLAGQTDTEIYERLIGQ